MKNYPMKLFLLRSVLTVIVFFALVSQGVTQTCVGQAAVAGTVELIDSLALCGGDTLRVKVLGNKDNPAFLTRFLLTDTNGRLLVVDNTTGFFPNLPEGTYVVYSYNFHFNNNAEFPPVLGGQINDLLNSSYGCFDLSTGLRVTVSSGEPPMALCRKDTIPVYLDSLGRVVLNPLAVDAGSKDDCTLDTLLLVPDTLWCPAIGIQAVLLIAVDRAGNRDTCIATIEVLDTIAPQAICGELTLALDATGIAVVNPNDLSIEQWDNCGIDSLWIAQDTFRVADLGQQTVAFHVRDSSGNRDTCFWAITIIDTLPPVALCQPVTLALDEGGEALLSAALVDAGSTDNSGIITSIGINRNVFTCAEKGQWPITLMVTDGSGNISACATTVTVLDTTPPQLTCQPITLLLDPAGLATLEPSDLVLENMDNCGIPELSISQSTFSCTDLGLREISLTATDASGNEASCRVAVTVLDTISPKVSCGVTPLFLDAGGKASLSAEQVSASSDNCVLALRTLEKSTFTCTDLGLQTVLVTVEDGSGNKSNCAAQITVSDTISPVALCKPATIYLGQDGTALLPAAAINAGSTDNCGELASIGVSRAEFNCQTTGTHPIVLTVTDGSGNMATCQTTVTVIDTIQPVVTCRPASIFLDTQGQATLSPAQINEGSRDNCGALLLRISKTNFSCADRGVQSVVLTGTDAFGRQASCSTSVSVLDTISPVAQCNSRVTLFLDTEGKATLSPLVLDNNSSDNCGSIVSWTTSKTSFNCADLGEQRVTLTIQDASGNSSSCSTLVMVRDTIAPRVTCQPVSLYLDAAGVADLSVTQVHGGSTDNCGTITGLALSRSRFTCADIVQPPRVTLVAIDGQGNEASCSALITILDTIPPKAVCTDQVVYLDAGGKATLDPELVGLGSTDNCSLGEEMTLDKATFSCLDVGQGRVTLTVKDRLGNLATCTAEVTVRDTIRPQPRCQPAKVYLDAGGIASVSVNQIDAGSTDNCGPLSSRELNISQFTCADIGQNTIVLTVRDGAGQSNSCSTTVTVLDTIRPVVTCQPATIYLDDQGTASLEPRALLLSTRDNCGGIARQQLSKQVFSCADLGSQAITLTVTDFQGNQASCSTTVTIRDTIPPRALCRPATIYLGADGNALLTPDRVDANSTDNCGVVSRRLSRTLFFCADRGVREVTLYVTDASGNTDSCRTQVTIVDQVRPRVVCKDLRLTLGTNGQVSLNPRDLDGGSTDNCTIVSYRAEKTVFTCADLGDNWIEFSATDAEGNTSVCLALVTILDATAPTFSCPANAQRTTLADGIADCFFTVTSRQFNPTALSDNCGISRVFHNFQGAPSDTTLLGAKFPIGNTQVTWTVVDRSGQQRSCAFTMTVVDQTAPTASLRDTVSITLNADGIGRLDSAAVDRGSSDNCGLASLRLSQNQFTCTDVGFRQVTVTLRDAAGNTTVRSVVVRVIASAACTPPPLVNTKRPEIGDPCSCLGNGLFSEEVYIGPSRPGQVWRVLETNLRNPATGLPFPVGTPFVERSIGPESSIYVLAGTHRDGEGYTLRASSLNYPDILSISNRCYYPKPAILSLPDVVCRSANPLTLKGTGGAGIGGVGSFTIDGKPATILDPKSLSLGKHIVTYTFQAGNPAGLLAPPDVGCTTSVSKEVEIFQGPSSYACILDVTVSMNSGCEILITPEMVTAMKLPCYDDYEVVLVYANSLVPNPVPASFAGLTLTYYLRYKPSNTIAPCQGRIKLLDLTGPQILHCPDTIKTGLICTDFDRVFNNPQTLIPGNPYYTGQPIVQDNCTGTTLTFQDEAFFGTQCQTSYISGIRRVFIIKDRFGNASSCSQIIYFNRPDELFWPADTTINLSCGATPLVDNKGNIAAQVAGFPYVLNGRGERVTLNGSSVCGYVATYEDQRFTLCASSYALLRTWRILNQCNPGELLTQVQFIQVGDFTPPKVQCSGPDLDRNGVPDGPWIFSTGPSSCGATFTVPQPLVEECSAYTVETSIYSWVPKNSPFGIPIGDSVFALLEVNITNNIAYDVPVGEHYFIHTVRDACGNLTRDTCLFRVVDKVAPSMICDNQLIVSLPQGGVVRITPADINEGTTDNCDPSPFFAVRRIWNSACTLSGEAETSEWGNWVEVTCCDIGSLVTVELRATDRYGNANSCITQIQVQDKINPICVAPPNRSVACTAFDSNFDGTDLVDLQRRFGIPTVEDNCEAQWEELTPVIQWNTCRVGTIRRRFRAIDASGNRSNISEQVVTITAVHDYRIKFPKDGIVYCGEPARDSLEIAEFACDILAVEVVEDRYTGSNDNCYALIRTYRVMNWCEYDGVSPPVVISRDADCDRKSGDEDVWVIVRPNGITYLDRDSDETNSSPVTGTKGISCDGTTNPRGYWINSNQRPSLVSRGFWEYTQFVTVVDTVPPVITFTDPGAICTLGDNSCTAKVDLAFRVQENCSPTQLTLTAWQDLGADGQLDGRVTTLQGTYPNYRISGTFGLGNHAFVLEVQDGCGNMRRVTMPFRVVDCKAPVSACISGLSVQLELLPPQTDVNGDGVADRAAMLIRARDFIASSGPDCSGPVRYSINREGEQPRLGQDSLWLTCADDDLVFLEIYSWDNANNPQAPQPGGGIGGPNAAKCISYVEIQRGPGVCEDLPAGEISGIIETENARRLSNVEVKLSGQGTDLVMSDAQGRYGFYNLIEGNDYTITPRRDGDDLLGVSTLDLILIRKHILGDKLLSTPYQRIAADANNSRSITTLDLIQVQKLILGYEPEFRDNTSWRFILKAFQFPNPANPWQTFFPEVYNINNLAGQSLAANFIAVKIGDVNGSYGNASATTAATRSDVRNALIWRLPDIRLTAGEEVTIPMRWTPGGLSWEGYQFTLQWAVDALELLDVVPLQVGANHLGVFPEEGLLTTNWLGEVPLQENAPVFQIRLRARHALRLADVMKLGSRITAAEAYQGENIMPVRLQFTESTWVAPGFSMTPNWPNPFTEDTRVELYFPQADQGTLAIFDAAGRMVWSRTLSFSPGNHRVFIPGKSLPAGVLYLRYRSAAYQGQQKMIHFH